MTDVVLNYELLDLIRSLPDLYGHCQDTGLYKMCVR